jgi:hypothetical protein
MYILVEGFVFWLLGTLVPGYLLEFDNSKPWLESSIVKCISWLKGSSFGYDDQGFSEKGKSRLI